jgi:hypothetical protein
LHETEVGSLTPDFVADLVRHPGHVPVTPPVHDADMAADAFTISCDDCTMQGTDACTDCVVTFICDRDPGDAIVIDVEEARAVRLLERAGLVPALRHSSRRAIGSAG